MENSETPEETPIVLSSDKDVITLAAGTPWEDREADWVELRRIWNEFDPETYRLDLLKRLGNKPVDAEQVYRHVMHQVSKRWEDFFNKKYEPPKSFLLSMRFLGELLKKK